jgi:DNA-binding NtrC family response regulator
LHILPLRKRTEDLEPLIHYFLSRICHEQSRKPCRLEPSALSLLLEYPYPGNVRELRNIMERLMVSAHGGVIQEEQVRLALQETDESPPGAKHENLEASARGFQIEAKRHTRLSIQAEEQKLIRQAMFETRGNKKAAAKLLGVSLTTLWRRLKVMRADAV